VNRVPILLPVWALGCVARGVMVVSAFLEAIGVIE
jgi:hypothetical protein